MKIKRKSEQLKKQKKVVSPPLKSTKIKKVPILNVSLSEKSNGAESSSNFLQKQPPRLSPRRVASKLITPSPSSNNSSANSSSTESNQLKADEAGGRRVSSRRRKPSWRVNFDPVDVEQHNVQADGSKWSKEQKTQPPRKASASSSPAPSDLKSVGIKRKPDSVKINRQHGDSFLVSTSRVMANGTSVRSNAVESVKSDTSKAEVTVPKNADSSLFPSTTSLEASLDNVEVIVLSEGESSVVNGHNSDDKCTIAVVEQCSSILDKQQKLNKRLKLTNDEDEAPQVNGKQLVTSINGISSKEDDVQSECNDVEELVVQVKSQSEDLLRKPSLENFYVAQSNRKFQDCCCNETIVGGKELRISKNSAAELLAVEVEDEPYDKDDYSIFVEPFCQAVDVVDSKRFGCIRPATENLALYRVSHRSPFRLLCSYHVQRLKLHQCCAICGHFCLQGPGVLLCTGNSPSKWTSHLFHRECAVEQIENTLDTAMELHELISNIVCPHCGHGGDLNEISVKFQAAQSPVFMPDRPPSLRKIAMVSVPKSVQIVTPAEHTLRYVEDSTASSLATAMEEAKMLLAESPSSVNRGQTFLRALLDGDIARVMAAIMLSGDVANTQFDAHRYQSALHLAVSSRNICLIHGLIVSGANPNVKDSDGYTPLMLAGKLNEPTIAKYLIAAGADKYAKGVEGMNVVHISAMTGNLLVLQSILEDHPNLARTVNDDGMTPLMVAAKYSRTEVVNYLATYWPTEINIRALDHHLNTALHWAAATGAVAAVSVLLQNGAEVNAFNHQGQTPLHWAVSRCRDGCVLALLVNHADLAAADIEGKTPLDICTEGTIDNEFQEHKSHNSKTESDSRAKQTIKNCIMQTAAIRSQLSVVTRDKESRYRIVSCDISCGKEPHQAIQCINEVDEEDLPEDFTYIIATVFRDCSSLTPPKITSSKTLKCNCQSDFSYDSNSMTLKEVENVNKKASQQVINNGAVPFVCSKECLCCSQNGLAYDSRGRIFSQVLSYLNATQLPVLQECNQLCKCDARICRNRVVQRGMTCQLQVFRKYNKKWAVKTIVRIPRGSFVCTYTGEIVTAFQYSSSWKKQLDSYTFELYDGYEDGTSATTILLDSSKFGNVSRFVNHSCSPNIVPIKILIEHEDERFPHIAFFSIRDIEAYEEVCYDFGEKFWELNIRKGLTCGCESEGCRYAQQSVTDEVDLAADYGDVV